MSEQRKPGRGDHSPERSHPDKIHHDKPAPRDERPADAVEQVPQLEDMVEGIVGHHAFERRCGEGHQVQISHKEHGPLRESPAARFIHGRVYAIRAQIDPRHMEPALREGERRPPVAATEFKHAGAVLLNTTEEMAILPAEKYLKELLVIPDLRIVPLTRNGALVGSLPADQDIILFPFHVYGGTVLMLPAPAGQAGRQIQGMRAPEGGDIWGNGDPPRKART